MREEPAKAPFRWVILGGVALLLLVPVGIWGAIVVPRQSEHTRLDAELAIALEDFREQRYVRLLLRGEVIEGNAYEAQIAALPPVGALPSQAFEGLGASLREGTALDADILAAVEHYQEPLEVYRRAVQRGWSWADFDPAADIPEFLEHLRASQLLIAAATLREPSECLATLADVIRLGQDRAAGRALVPLMIHHAVVRMLLQPTLRCLVAGDAEARAQAARELEILASHPAPTGYVLEAETLFAGAMFSEVLQDTPAFPTNGAELEAWLSASEMLEAWELRMGTPSDNRHIGHDYPADFAAMDSWQRGLVASGNDTLAIAMPALSRYLERDAGTRAAIRALRTVAFVMGHLASLPTEPPEWLADADQLDPQTGAPFEWVSQADGVLLRSFGRDRVPDGETEDNDIELLIPASAFARPEAVPRALTEETTPDPEPSAPLLDGVADGP